MDSPEDRDPVSRRTLLKGLGAGGLVAAAWLSLDGIQQRSEDQSGPPTSDGNQSTTPGRTDRQPGTSTERPPAESSTVERRGITFDRSVDIVEDFDADPDGNAPINRALEAAMEPGTLVRFPPGTYQLAPQTIPITHDRVGILGEGEVTWHLATGFHGRIVNCERDEFLFEGVDLDMSGTPWESGHLRVFSPSRFFVGDVAFIGRGRGPGYAIKPAITEATTGRGTIREVSVPHGSRPDMYASSTSGIRGNGRIGAYVGKVHVGVIEVIGCEFSEFGNNGIYASKTNGDVRVEDSYFANNGANNVRLSGGGSWVKRTVVEVDMRAYDGPPIEAEWGTWGITAENTRRGATSDEFPPKEPGMLVEDCDVRLLNIDDRGHVGAGIRLASNARSMRVRNTRVTVDVDRGFGRTTHGILRINPFLDLKRYRSDMPVAPKPHGMHLENVTITGSASGSSAVRFAHADGSTVTNCSISQPGANRDGVRFIRSAGCTIDGGNFRTGGFPLVFDSADPGELCALRNEPTFVKLDDGTPHRLDNLSFDPDTEVLLLQTVPGDGVATLNISEIDGTRINGTVASADGTA